MDAVMELTEKEKSTGSSVEESGTRQRSKRSRTKELDKCSNQELGRRGEDAAANFLHSRGYEILERNWTCRFGEADIIARDSNTIVFVEVKTRRNVEKGFPGEAVTAAKRDRYERIALAYLEDCVGLTDLSVRFDVISIVVVSVNRAVIRHHISAFSTL